MVQNRAFNLAMLKALGVSSFCDITIASIGFSGKQKTRAYIAHGSIGLISYN
jgi:hypothetical protein